MSKKVDKLLWLLVANLVRRQRRSMVHLARIKAARLYVKGVQAARITFLGVLGLCLMRLLLVGGFVLLHVGLFVYLPWELQDKGLLLLILGGVYLLVVLIGAAIAGSEKVWMRCTQADEVVASAVRNEPMDS